MVAGKGLPAGGEGRCFAFVQTHDAEPQRRLFEALQSQGPAGSRQITFLTDGGEDIRDLPLRTGPRSEHLLDWFHVTMRLTVLRQMAKGLPDRAAGRDHPRAGPAQVVPVARQRVPGPAEDRRPGVRPRNGPGPAAGGRLGPAAGRQAARTAQDGGRVRRVQPRRRRQHPPTTASGTGRGEVISTSFVESAVNQVVSKRMVKKQQMRWTPEGAHLMLQIRTRVLNGDLVDGFHRWYPNFTRQDPDDHAIAA